MDYRFLGKQIRHFRHEQELTQEKLAELVDVSASFIGHIERGSRKASLETMVRISEALDVSLDRLIMPDRKKGNSEYSDEQFKRARELLQIALQLSD